MKIRRQSFKGIWAKVPSFMRRWYELYYYRKLIPDTLNRFLTDEERANNNYVRKIRKDLLECRDKYKIEPNEYFWFDFRNLRDNQRGEFLTRIVKNNILQRLVGYDVENKELRDKYHFYEMMKPYFCRDVMLISKGGGNLQDFVFFARKHKDCFIKSNSMSKGRGAGLYHIESDEEAEKVYINLRNAGGDWIVEEKVIQSASVAQWNESSVNTIRLPAILKDGRWTVFGPCFRTGRKGQVVDNASAGGMFACINPQTGIIYTDGYDDKCAKYYENHPDSGLTFKGWQVPRWTELLVLAEKIHRTIPHHFYVGWDFALTDNGWVLIEGNWGALLSQYNDHVGLKKKFFELLGETEK